MNNPPGREEEKMPVEIEMEPNFNHGAKIRVVGIGGAGNNAINTMIEAGLEGVEFIAANTDLQALERSLAKVRLQLGRTITGGLGAGADPEKGRKAALEDREKIKELLSGSDMVFITAGLGGGTGTGGAPVVAEVAREVGALTVAVVTKPFAFELKQKMKIAERGLTELKEIVDAAIVIPNSRLYATASKNIPFRQMLKKADEVLMAAVRGITDIITKEGVINVDFADVRAVMSEMGEALIGTGEASGDDRAKNAAHMAINNPLLEELSIEGAKAMVINLTAASNITAQEVNEALSYITEQVSPDAKVIQGLVEDENMGDAIRITVIATGMGRERAIGPEQLDPTELDEFGVMSRVGGKLRAMGAQGSTARDMAHLEIPTFVRRQAD